MMQTTMGWHFLRGDKLRDGSPAPDDWKPLVYSGEVEICQSGLHFSERIRYALNYAPGLDLCRVCCAQVVTRHSDKAVCRQRTILWRIPAERMRRVVVWWAYWCAERAKEHSAAAANAAAAAAYAAYAANAAYAAANAAYAAAAAANAAANAAAYADYADYAAAERQAQENELIRLIELARIDHEIHNRTRRN